MEGRWGIKFRREHSRPQHLPQLARTPFPYVLRNVHNSRSTWTLEKTTTTKCLALGHADHMFSISIIHGLNLAQNWTKPYWDSTTRAIHSNVPYLIWTSKRWWGHQTRYSSTASAACKWHEFSALIELNIRFACPPSFFSRWSNFNLMRLWNKKTQCLRFYLALVHEKMLMNVFVPQFSQRKILIDKFLCKSCVTHQKKMNDRKSHQGFDFIDLLINFATCCENPPKFITTYFY